MILFGYRFEEQEAPGSRSFFTEIIASISDIKFGREGRYILSRDYMTLKVRIFFAIKQALCFYKAFVNLSFTECVFVYICHGVEFFLACLVKNLCKQHASSSVTKS